MGRIWWLKLRKMVKFNINSYTVNIGFLKWNGLSNRNNTI